MLDDESAALAMLASLTPLFLTVLENPAKI
jgi:hypothetical protein